MKHSPKLQEIGASLQESLRERGYKLTPQRKAIIDLLAGDLSHPGAADIFNKIRKSLPHVSLSTVYYTLDMLKKEGLIHEIEFYDRDNRYDVNMASHINLICRKCGKIEDFPAELPYSSEAVKKKTGFQPIQMRFEYYGYCKQCGKVKKS